jgi:hypothetical protein
MKIMTKNLLQIVFAVVLNLAYLIHLCLIHYLLIFFNLIPSFTVNLLTFLLSSLHTSNFQYLDQFFSNISLLVLLRQTISCQFSLREESIQSYTSYCQSYCSICLQVLVFTCCFNCLRSLTLPISFHFFVKFADIYFNVFVISFMPSQKISEL